MPSSRFPRKPHKLGFFALLVTLLGLGGCQTLEDDPNNGQILCMYGTPTAQFSVKGKVTDEQGHPIEGLQVILGKRYYDSPSVQYDTHYFLVDTIKTDADGIYRFSSPNIFPIHNLQVDVNDIDGPAGGGEFKSASTVIRDIEYKEGNGWYVGKADVEVPKIKLKKK